MVNNGGDRQSLKDRVVGPLPNGRTSWLINGGDPITTYVRPGSPSSKWVFVVGKFKRLTKELILYLGLRIFFINSYIFVSC